MKKDNTLNSRRKPTLDHGKVMEGLLAGKKKSVIAVEAGSKAKGTKAQANTATTIMKTERFKDALRRFISDEDALEVHKQGLVASKFKQGMGMIPDHENRHRFLKTFYELRGLLKNSAPPSTNIINSSKILILNENR